ncbi:MAG: hypothetical protein IKC43_00355, partial [Clostridia bacterium]|nr:hypothetical protein [Clostridia bacterium]
APQVRINVMHLTSSSVMRFAHAKRDVLRDPAQNDEMSSHSELIVARDRARARRREYHSFHAPWCIS